MADNALMKYLVDPRTSPYFGRGVGPEGDAYGAGGGNGIGFLNALMTLPGAEQYLTGSGNMNESGGRIDPDALAAYLQANGLSLNEVPTEGGGGGQRFLTDAAGNIVGTPENYSNEDSNFWTAAQLAAAGVGASVAMNPAYGGMGSGSGLGAVDPYSAASGWGGDTLGAMGAEGFGPGGTFTGGLAGGTGGLPAEFGGAMGVGGGAAEGGLGTLGNIAPGAMGGGDLATMGAYAGGTAPTASATLSPALSAPGWGTTALNALGNPYGLAQLGSAAIGMYGNNKAIGAYQDSTNQANQFQREALDYTKELNAPLVGLRNSVLPQINALLTNPGSITSDPGYQFGLKQGADQLNNRAAASGGYYSGGQMKAAQRYGQDYAGTKLDQSLNRLNAAAGLGQVGANNAQQGFQQGTNALAGNALNLGNARGSLYGGNAQIVQNSLGNIFNPWQYDQINGGRG